MSCAWIIDTDHIADRSSPEGTNSNAKGVCGPRDAPEWMENALLTSTVPAWAIIQGAAIYRFNVYDDDGELYYTGRMITEANPPDDEACAGPLFDFGGPNGGATNAAMVQVSTLGLRELFEETFSTSGGWSAEHPFIDGIDPAKVNWQEIYNSLHEGE